MSKHHHTLARSAGVFTGATLLSRILGYARDSMVANFFGAGIAADAFYAAFRISNLFRRLLAEGALSASFIPIFAEYGETHGKEETQKFLNAMFTALLALVTIVTVLGIAFAPLVTRLIATGFAPGSERFELTVLLTRAMFPFLLFVSLAALITGVLNAYHSFFLPALAPASLSIAEIAYILALAPLLSPRDQVLGLALSVVVGGFGQFFVHIPALRKKGFTLRWNWDWHHRGVKRVGKLMAPATLGISVDQINAFVDTICASYLASGSITALYYANRVMQLPLALFGIALSQVSLPVLSAAVVRRDTAHVKETINFALRLTLFMILPATAGLMTLGEPIVRILFQHGKFDSAATLMTNQALFYFSSGLFAYAVVKILAGAFYAYQNTRVPVVIATVCVALNILLNIVLIKFTQMGVGGLALSTALASWVNAITLFVMLRRKLGLLGGQRILMTVFKSGAGCSLMVLFCRFVMSHGPTIPVAVRLTAGISGGALLYLAVARLLRMEEWDPFWHQLSRRRPKALAD